MKNIKIKNQKSKMPTLRFLFSTLLPFYLSTRRLVFLSTFLPFYLSTRRLVYLSTILPFYLSIRRLVYLSTILPFYLSIRRLVYLSTILHFYLSIRRLVFLSTLLPFYLSIRRLVFLSTLLPFYLSIRRLVFLSTLLPFYLSTCLYSVTPGTTAANFLKIGVGPRAVGLGESYVAVADDVNTIFWNPAGLNLLQQQEATFMYNKWFEDIYQGFIGYAKPISQRTAVGLSAQYLSMKEIPGYDDLDNEIADVKAQDMALNVSYSRKIRKELNIGASMKYINQQLDDEHAFAFAMDVGSLYRFTALPLSVGLVVQNFGTKVKFVERQGVLPTNVKFGSAFQLFNKKITLASDLNFPIDNDAYFSIGGECRPSDLIALRAGYRSNTDLGNGLTFGAGFKINGWQVDYAFVNYGIFKCTHRMSLLVRFGKTAGSEPVVQQKSFIEEAIKKSDNGITSEPVEPTDFVKEIEIPSAKEETTVRPELLSAATKAEEQDAKEVAEIVPSVLQKDVKPVLVGAREPEMATRPPRPVIVNTKEIKKDMVVARIFFKFESDQLTKQSRQTLNKLIKIIKKFPKNRVMIEGHTCNFGAKETNKALAISRSVGVKIYFMNGGISRRRITTKCCSYRQPIAKNDTSENRAQNRRVDVVVLKVQ